MSSWIFNRWDSFTPAELDLIERAIDASFLAASDKLVGPIDDWDDDDRTRQHSLNLLQYEIRQHIRAQVWSV